MDNYTCQFPDCGKSFKARKSLVEHMRIHKGEKPYQCHYEGCQKRFTQYSSMQKHERTHSGDKPYKCSICDRDFTQISNLKRHERVHAGEKPHECEICQKKFSTASNLKQHMGIHERGDIREKYLCQLCKKSYLYRSSLRKHLHEHGEEGILLGLKVEADIEAEALFNDKISVKEEDHRFEEEEEEIYQEPELSKYVFVDQNTTARFLPMTYKPDYEPAEYVTSNYKPTIETRSALPAIGFNFDFFPSFPTSYPMRQEPPTKKLSMSSLLGSPLRDCPSKENQWENSFNFRNPKNSAVLIEYKGMIYFLYDRLLNRTKPNGELIMRQIDNDSENPSQGVHLPEMTHFSDHGSLFKVYQDIAAKNSKKVTLEMLFTGKACNSITCGCTAGQEGCKKCGCVMKKDEIHHGQFHSNGLDLTFCDDKLLHSPLSFSKEIESNGSPFNYVKEEEDGHVCICEATREYKHVHGPNCGHHAIMHDGHVDYIVNGKLHHPDGDHCDDHGPIRVVENTNEDYAFGVISSHNALPERKIQTFKEVSTLF